MRREGAKKSLWFFVNASDGPARIAETPKGKDLLTGRTTGGELMLEPNGVAVIRTGKA